MLSLTITNEILCTVFNGCLDYYCSVINFKLNKYLNIFIHLVKIVDLGRWDIIFI
ncbi:GD20295 [Drosophila simulans]|uniref:GD20295 n=1 Tax=Drosophila simulans TaxID=7240 RepID=B4QX43_DROSI|nr:GD20295 [Drosophila simulans]